MRPISKTLYYFLYNALLDGNFKKAKLYLDLLKKEYKSKPQEFKASFTKNQKDHLKVLEKSVKTRSFISPSKNLEIDFEKIKPEGDPVEKEYILRDSIASNNFNNLMEELGVKNFQIWGCEVPILDGYVDIAFDSKEQEETTCNIIELKAGVADHRIIGQIKKYRNYFLKRLIYNLYQNVNTIVIAQGYTSDSILELKKMNVTTLVYRKDKKTFKFVKV